jgi:ABC-type uncharacterized transport system permease subunit
MRTDWRYQAVTLLKNLAKKLGLILLAMLVASLFLLVSGYDFLAVFKGVWLGITSDFSGTIRWMTPLLFTSIAVCLSQKAKLFNLGVDGQLYLGACAASLIALRLTGLPPLMTILVSILAGMTAGLIYAGIPALLKIYMGADEVVTTLLMNFVAVQFTEWLVLGPLKPQQVTGTTSTANFAKELWLPRILTPSQANIGLYVALFCAALLAFVMYKTSFGHEVKIVGANSRFAKYSGINVVRVTLFTMLVSGAVAGLAGSVEVLGSLHRLPTGFNPDLGFNGIVVSLLAQNNPIGCVVASFFFAALKNGASNMERISDIPAAVSEIVQALVILTVTVTVVAPQIKSRLADRRALKEALSKDKKSSGKEDEANE